MKTIVLILSLFLSTSCSNDDDNSVTAQSTPITFTEIGKGALFGNGTEGISQSNIVIDNTTDWQNLMTQMNSFNNVTNEFLETNIDFNTYTVIGIFLEVKTSGWEVEISNIEENTTDIMVSKTETEAVNSVITQPFHIVKIPVTNKPIEFE
jgi:hypothetical protein